MMSAGTWPRGWSRICFNVAHFTSPRNLPMALFSTRSLPVGGAQSRSRHGKTVFSASYLRFSSVSHEKVDMRQSSDSSSIESDAATPFRKRKVAIWVGYVGTAFRGLQILPEPDAANTIEYELERAIYRAGGILDTNHGHLEKLGWSRSSRTDKGVHSLSTVISMKMEIPPSAWMDDPDGLLLAENINVHLPPTIQVFGIVPVTKSFEARRFCCNRTYHYLLPASLIGVAGRSSSEEIGRILEDFRTVLSKFQGRFAFHNYTIRKLYRADVRSKKSSANRSKQRPAALLDKAEAGKDEPHEDLAQHNVLLEVPTMKESDLEVSEPRRAYWLDAPDDSDKLSASHFRRILSASCGGLENYAGTQFVRISITGESFMIHQIRKMVATAVAVAKGALPQDIVPISLCRHARIVLPLAPSEGLVLAKNSFMPFRQPLVPQEQRFRASDVGVSRLKELPKLQVSTQMSERVDTFWRNVLLPELAPQLDSSLQIWSEWVEYLTQRTIPEAQIASVRASYTNWREESQLKWDAAAAEVERLTLDESKENF